MKYKYCPNGNYWKDASGVFDERTYMYCVCNKCNGKVYELRPIDVTKKLSNEQIQSAKDNVFYKKVRGKISYKNMQRVSDFIDSLEEKNETD